MRGRAWRRDAAVTWRRNAAERLGKWGWWDGAERLQSRRAVRYRTREEEVTGEEELTEQGPSGGKRRRGRECWAVVGDREGGLGRFRPGEENRDFSLFLLDFWFGIWEGILKSGEYFGLSGDF